MHFNAPPAYWLIALTLSGAAHASGIQRCEDAAGNVTFTAFGCPSGQERDWQPVPNPAPGSMLQMLPAAEPPKQSGRRATKARSSDEILLIGQRDDGCSNRLSADQRRRAIINQRTPPGMTRRDVESLLGRPDKVVSRNGETRYVYLEKKGRSNQVTFDAHDCVKGKR